MLFRILSSKRVLITAVFTFGILSWAGNGFGQTDCKSLYQWRKNTGFDSVKPKIESLIDKYREPGDLFTVEKCIQSEADRLNEQWAGKHLKLVMGLNAAREKLTEYENVKNEVMQLERSIEIQDQALESIRLVYQGKLMEIPKAYC